MHLDCSHEFGLVLIMMSYSPQHLSNSVLVKTKLMLSLMKEEKVQNIGQSQIVMVYQRFDL